MSPSNNVNGNTNISSKGKDNSKGNDSDSDIDSDNGNSNGKCDSNGNVIINGANDPDRPESEALQQYNCANCGVPNAPNKCSRCKFTWYVYINMMSVSMYKCMICVCMMFFRSNTII